MSKKKQKKIVVGTNCLTEIQHPAYTNHCQTWFRFGRSCLDYDFILCAPSRMGIDSMRNMSAKVALEQQADYLLFMDDDVCVPTTNGLKFLLWCNADIAAGNVLIRNPPFDYMYFKEDGHGGLRHFTTTEIQHIHNSGKLMLDREDGLGAVGCSFCLIKVDLLRKMQPPYFLTCGNCTEDVYFCIKAKEAKPDLTMCVDLGVQCGHIMWPELISPANRETYTRYYNETAYIMPSCLNQAAQQVQQAQQAGPMNNEQLQKLMVENLAVGDQ